MSRCPSLCLSLVMTPSPLSCLFMSRCMQSSSRNHPLQVILLPRLGKRSRIFVTWGGARTRLCSWPGRVLRTGAAWAAIAEGEPARRRTQQQRWHSRCTESCAMPGQGPARARMPGRQLPSSHPPASMGDDNKAEVIMNRRPRF